MSEFDFLKPIPKATVSVKLPSRGVLYRDDTPAGKGKLNMSPMTMVDEGYFLDPDMGFSKAIDKILKRCVQEDLDINTLLSSDKFFLFMMLRAVTYGPDYTFTWSCTAEKARNTVCGHKNTATVKIPDDFKMKYLADGDKEPFAVTLPDCQREISFRLLRGYDDEYIDRFVQEAEAKKKEGIIIPDRTSVFRLSRHIVKVDGKDVKNAPGDLLLNFVASFSARDRQFLQSKINFYTPGLDTGVTLVCEKCHMVHEWDMPFTANFFRAITDNIEGEAVADEVRSDVLSGDDA